MTGEADRELMHDPVRGRGEDERDILALDGPLEDTSEGGDGDVPRIVGVDEPDEWPELMLTSDTDMSSFAPSTMLNADLVKGGEDGLSLPNCWEKLAPIAFWDLRLSAGYLQSSTYPRVPDMIER